jgi:hypothetical protein
VADYDADGVEELAILTYDPTTNGSTFLLSSANLADGADPTTQPWITFQTSAAEEGLGWQSENGDFDGDGLIELATTDPSGTVWLFEPPSGGILSTSDAVARMTGMAVYGWSPGLDQDGDGIDELWVADFDDLLRLPGPVTGTIDQTAADTQITGLYMAPLLTGGDLDGDGLPELVVADYEQVYVLGGQTPSGDLSTVATAQIDLEGYSTDPRPGLGDFDGDGQVDLALGLYGVDQQAEDGGQILFFTGSLSGNLLRGDATTAYTGTTPGGYAGNILLPADLDRDQKVDLISTEGQNLLVLSGADLP